MVVVALAVESTSHRRRQVGHDTNPLNQPTCSVCAVSRIFEPLFGQVWIARSSVSKHQQEVPVGSAKPHIRWAETAKNAFGVEPPLWPSDKWESQRDTCINLGLESQTKI